ncbi:MAG TPA: LysR family transcriptional regulator [Aestuariivirga sp.]|nr:LysR family transcriptional regulator [Aestuariivirga sp.]
MRHLTLKQLRAFAETVRHGSITGAAQALNVTPPAISLQLKLLEEMAGLPLLIRDEKGFRPTDAGQVVVETAQRVEAVMRDGGEALRSLRGGVHGTVHVGVVSTAKYFAPRALAAFRSLHPEIELKLSVGNRDETVAALRNYDLDFAVMGRPPKDFAVEQEQIGPHPHVVIARPDHPLAREAEVSLEMLAHETFLVREAASGTRALTDQLLARMARGPVIGMEISSNETIKQAVMAGLGVALISAHTVANEVNEGKLGIIQAEGLPIVRMWYVVRRADRPLLPATRALWRYFVEEVGAMLPQISGMSLSDEL